MIFYVVDLDGIFQMSDGKGLGSRRTSSRSRSSGKSIFEIYAQQAEILERASSGLDGQKTDFSVPDSLLSESRYYYEVSRLAALRHRQSGHRRDCRRQRHHRSHRRSSTTLEATIQRLTLLRRIEVELSESLDLNSVLTIAMDTAQRATGAEHGFIGLIEGDQLRVVHAAGDYVDRHELRLQSAASSGGRCARASRSLSSMSMPTPISSATFPASQAQMTIPLIHRDHLIGVLSLETAKPKLFTTKPSTFSALIAGHITVAIDNAQLYQVSQQQLDELHQLYMRVSELEQLKTDMIRIAAHDLRNPLGVVNGYAEMLLEDEDSLTEEQRSFVESIDRAGQKMLKIINDILSLQRIEAIRRMTSTVMKSICRHWCATFTTGMPRARAENGQILQL